MLNHEEEIAKLDKIARNLTGEGTIKSLKVPTPSGYDVEITVQKYCQLVEAGQNPITHIFNLTATATATSSLTVSQKIESIIHDLEKSNFDSKKLPEARRKLKTLESELDKPNPSEKVIRKIMRWASNFGLELSLRIAVIVAERYL